MRRILRLIFRRKTLAVAAFVIVFLVTLYVVARTFERWRGERAWREYVKGATARGVKLWIQDFIPPEVPPAENFAAIPVFEELFRDPQAPRRFDLKNPMPILTEPNKSRRDVLAEWQEHLVKERMLAAPDPDPARGVLAALEKFRPDLEQIREATRRPHTHFPVRWEDGWGASFPHFIPLLQIGRMLNMRSVAHLALNDSASALADIKDVIGIYRAIKGEPLYIFGTVRQILLLEAADVVRDGLISGGWSDEALGELVREFSKGRLLEDWVFTLQSERAFQNATIASLSGKSSRELAAFFAPFSKWTPNPVVKSRMVLAWSLYPRGWFIQSQVKLNRLFDTAIARIDLVEGRVAAADFFNYGKLRPRSTPARLYDFLFNRMLEVMGGEQSFVSAEVGVRQTATACALELFRRAHGQFPERLDELVPAFLLRVPGDPYDGAPMRYRRGDAAAYRLWCIGEDRIDGGGKDPEDVVWSFGSSH
jgi:hypothetical protein